MRRSYALPMEKVIGFAENLVPLVESGEKTITYRLGDKYDFLQTGDSIRAFNSSDGKFFANLEIVNKSYCTFKDLDSEKQNLFVEFYKRKITADEKVIIFDFKVIELIK